MARANFKYEKRQKELAKQKKAEEKRLRRLEKRNEADGDVPQEPSELPEGSADTEPDANAETSAPDASQAPE